MRDILEKYGITPNKALGQNFLIDTFAIDKIIDAAAIDGKSVLEIGPGLGALTHGLNARSQRLLAVEISSAMVSALQSQVWEKPDDMQILHSDFLKIKDETLTEFLGDTISVVANLPYYVTTPICMKLLQSGIHIESMTLMMQKEAAAHFTATPGNKLYGSVAILTDYLFTVHEVLELSKQSYYPQPDVYSVVLNFTEKGADRSKVQDLSRVLKAAFSTRRKTIQNNISTIGFSKAETAEILCKAGISCSERAEKLTLEDFLRLECIIRSSRSNT